MNPGDLDLNLLWALHALLRERQVTRAANSIGLGQPAMSAALGRLRRIFDDELLVRVGGESHLTPLAIELRPQVEEIMAGVDRLVSRRSAFKPENEKRVFSISATDMMTVLALGPVMKRISSEAPGISLQISPIAPFEQVEAGIADLMIAPAYQPTTLHSEIIFENRFVVALWTDHPEVGEHLTMEQYQRLPHISYGRIGAVPRLRPEALNHREVHVACRSYWSFPFLLEGTTLLAVVPESIGRLFASVAKVRLVDLPIKAVPFQAKLLWHPRHDDDQAFLWIRGLIREACIASGSRHEGRAVRYLPE